MQYERNVNLQEGCCCSLLQLVIPLTTQDDLDKAVELLDRSVHMKSLKILLVLQMSSQVSRDKRSILILIQSFIPGCVSQRKENTANQC